MADMLGFSFNSKAGRLDDDLGGTGRSIPPSLMAPKSTSKQVSKAVSKAVSKTAPTPAANPAAKRTAKQMADRSSKTQMPVASTRFQTTPARAPTLAMVGVAEKATANDDAARSTRTEVLDDDDVVYARAQKPMSGRCTLDDDAAGGTDGGVAVVAGKVVGLYFPMREQSADGVRTVWMRTKLAHPTTGRLTWQWVPIVRIHDGKRERFVGEFDTVAANV
jgi:hypothetical protein